jgi:hypothetical protein
MSTHLTMVTRWPPSSANQDQAIYGWSTEPHQCARLAMLPGTEEQDPPTGGELLKASLFERSGNIGSALNWDSAARNKVCHLSGAHCSCVDKVIL